MSVLRFETNYKNKVIELLYSNPDFIKLINPENKYPDYLDTIDVLNGGTFEIDGKIVKEQGYVFDHDFVDETVNDEKTFVFVETTVDSVKNNFVDFNLFICFFSIKNLVRIDSASCPNILDVKNMGYEVGSYANRIDILADVIEDTILANTNEFQSLGDISPSSRGHLQKYCPLFGYYGKCLKYTVKNYNTGSDSCGNK